MNADTSTTKNCETETLEEKLQNEEMLVEVERKTGVSFPVKLSDRKELIAVGLRRKNFLGLSFRVYSFGTIYYIIYVNGLLSRTTEHCNRVVEYINCMHHF